MAYLFYSLGVLVIIFGTLLYFTRPHWLAGFQDIMARISFPGSAYLYLYTRLPTSFRGDVEAGLTSPNFDLRANIEEGDGRAGLDDEAKREVLKIMKKRRLRFDEARRVYMEQRFQANGIGIDGRPRDPKFVSFS